jgi:hypothetical protein
MGSVLHDFGGIFGEDSRVKNSKTSTKYLLEW